MTTTAASKAAPTAAVAERMPWALLAAAGLASFAATASGTTRSPFLLDMAHDLATSLPMVANLTAMTSVSWGGASVLAGLSSDRWGRRIFLIGGSFALSGCLIGIALAGDFLTLAVWVVIAGACCGAFTGVIFAEVAARVAESLRGRALGWVMNGQSLTLLVGVPLAAWIGNGIGWRGVNLCVAGLALAASLGLIATVRRPVAPGPAGGRAPVSIRAALSGPVLRLLSMGVAERICYGLAAIYYATFLIATYQVTLAAIALPLALFATGNILGTALGGQLADRLPNRLRSFAIAMVASGGAALLLFGWPRDLATSVGLGFVYMLLNGIGRPSYMAALAGVPEQHRGTVLGMNGATASLGWVGAAALGGWSVATVGFAGFGPLTAVVALIGAALALVRWR